MEGFEPTNIDCFSVDHKDLEALSHVFSLYASYAHSKACAMKFRHKGDIEAAVAFEKNADHTYKQLPVWARW
jgi:hypothetical protein